MVRVRVQFRVKAYVKVWVTFKVGAEVMVAVSNKVRCPHQPGNRPSHWLG